METGDRLVANRPKDPDLYYTVKQTWFATTPAAAAAAACFLLLRMSWLVPPTPTTRRHVREGLDCDGYMYVLV